LRHRSNVRSRQSFAQIQVAGFNRFYRAFVNHLLRIKNQGSLFLLRQFKVGDIVERPYRFT